MSKRILVLSVGPAAIVGLHIAEEIGEEIPECLGPFLNLGFLKGLKELQGVSFVGGVCGDFLPPAVAASVIEVVEAVTLG